MINKIPYREEKSLVFLSYPGPISDCDPGNQLWFPGIKRYKAPHPLLKLLNWIFVQISFAMFWNLWKTIFPIFFNFWDLINFVLATLTKLANKMIKMTDFVFFVPKDARYPKIYEKSILWFLRSLSQLRICNSGEGRGKPPIKK